MAVLVTDAHERSALAAVRSLGARGLEVWAAGASRLDQALYSRYCAGRIICPDPTRSMARFADFMLAFARRGRCGVLLPMSDHTTLFASRYREELAPHVRTAVPDWQALLLANDKPKLLGFARQMGIDVPATHSPRGRAELEEVARSMRYPCVVKPRKGAGAVAVSYPSSPDELLSVWEAPRRRSDEVYDYASLIVQEYVPGEVHDVCAMFDRGRPVAVTSERRIKMFPLSGGRTIVGQMTDQPELKDKAVALLERLRWHGPADVEFKIDSRDGRPKLMEVNARFWGILGLAIEAGIDFPYLAYCIATGQDVRPVSEYKVGLKYRSIFPLELAHVAASGRRLRGIREFLDFGADTRCEIQLADPLPLVAEAVSCARKALRSPRRYAEMLKGPSRASQGRGPSPIKGCSPSAIVRQ